MKRGLVSRLRSVLTVVAAVGISIYVLVPFLLPEDILAGMPSYVLAILGWALVPVFLAAIILAMIDRFKLS